MSKELDDAFRHGTLKIRWMRLRAHPMIDIYLAFGGLLVGATLCAVGPALGIFLGSSIETWPGKLALGLPVVGLGVMVDVVLVMFAAMVVDERLNYQAENKQDKQGSP